jgi:hypothetical protein
MELTRFYSKQHRGERRYFSFDGELLFVSAYRPEGFFDSWFAKCQSVTFQINCRDFAIQDPNLAGKSEVHLNGSRYCLIENRDNLEVVLTREGIACTAASPQGPVTTNRTFEGVFEGRLAFRLRVPRFREWIRGLHELRQLSSMVGEYRMSEKYNPDVAITFMFTEMFLDRGYASGNI